MTLINMSQIKLLTYTMKIYTLFVMFHIGWGGEQITIYKGVETFP